MVHAPIELGPVVSAGIAHDRIVIAERAGERINRRGGFLVGRIGFAGFDRAPRALKTDIAVAAAECRGSVGRAPASNCASNWATIDQPSQPYGARLCRARTPK